MCLSVCLFALFVPKLFGPEGPRFDSRWWYPVFRIFDCIAYSEGRYLGVSRIYIYVECKIASASGVAIFMWNIDPCNVFAMVQKRYRGAHFEFAMTTPQALVNLRSTYIYIYVKPQNWTLQNKWNSEQNQKTNTSTGNRTRDLWIPRRAYYRAKSLSRT